MGNNKNYCHCCPLILQTVKAEPRVKEKYSGRIWLPPHFCQAVQLGNIHQEIFPSLSHQKESLAVCTLVQQKKEKATLWTLVWKHEQVLGNAMAKESRGGQKHGAWGGPYKGKWKFIAPLLVNGQPRISLGHVMVWQKYFLSHFMATRNKLLLECKLEVRLKVGWGGSSCSSLEFNGGSYTVIKLSM